MFGGDVDKAIDNFRPSTELDPKSDETFVWLAIAYRKKGDTASSDQALLKALRLNPGSVFARHTQANQ
jgi:Tfp pilus assembly protein PilF